MIRQRCSSPLLFMCAAMLGALWLSGCVSTTLEGPATTTDPERTVALNVRMGTAYMEQGDLIRAHDKLDKALAIDPDNPDALQTRALVYQLQGEDELTNTLFKRALSAAPHFTRARNNYAAFLYSQGRTAEACDQLEQASRNIDYDDRARLFTNLGLCQRELGNLEAARKNLQRAQDINPRSARSYYTLAEINYAQGANERAWEQLQSYIRLSGSNPASLRLAEKIATVRSDTASAAFYSRQLDGSQGAP